MSDYPLQKVYKVKNSDVMPVSSDFLDTSNDHSSQRQINTRDDISDTSSDSDAVNEAEAEPDLSIRRTTRERRPPLRFNEEEWEL